MLESYAMCSALLPILFIRHIHVHASAVIKGAAKNEVCTVHKYRKYTLSLPGKKRQYKQSFLLLCCFD